MKHMFRRWRLGVSVQLMESVLWVYKAIEAEPFEFVIQLGGDRRQVAELVTLIG
jgi:hypothetical protein